MNAKSRLPIVLLLLAIPFSSAFAGSALDDAEQVIIRKLAEDRAYYAWRLKQKKDGVVPTDIKKDVAATFAREVTRAKNMIPVIDYVIHTVEKTKTGERINLAKLKSQTYRTLGVYLNLISLVRAGNYQRARVLAGRIKLAEGFGKTQSMPDFSELLTRHFYYLRGIVFYNLHDDADAVQWFGQISKDTHVRAMNLKKKKDLVNNRLANLHEKPIAVAAFRNLKKSKDTDWIGLAVSEVMVNDLSNLTGLKLVERQRLADIMKEAELGMLGIVSEDDAAKVGSLLGTGTMVIGTYSSNGDIFTVSGRLVHVESGTVLASAMKQGSPDAVIPTTREMSIDLLAKAGLITSSETRKIESARTPKAAAVKAMAEARMLMASRPDDARALYEKAMRADPSYANAFKEMRMKFKDVSALVAVMGFSNTTAKNEDDWMKEGIAETISTDINVLGFNTVERLQLQKAVQYETEQATQKAMAGEGFISTLGKKVAANFMVVGSFQRFADQLKINFRFFDVETGQILYANSVQGKYQDYSHLVTELINKLGTHLNRPLNKEQMAKMVQGKPSIEEFKKFMLKQAAKDELAVKQDREGFKEKKKQDAATRKAELQARVESQIQDQLKQSNRKRTINKYIGIGGIAAGLVVAVVSQYQHTSNSESASEALTMAKQAIRQEDQDLYNDRFQDYDQKSTAWQAATFAGVGLSVAGVVYWFLTAEPKVDMSGIDLPDMTSPNGLNVAPTDQGATVNYTLSW